MISTRDLAALPDIDHLKALLQSLAMLDAIICPDWEGRYYSFNARWAPGKALASMRNGEGDNYFALFTSAGAILKGFAHEAPTSPYRHKPSQVWPGVLDSVPPVFAEFLAEPAFSIEDTTFCIWRTYTDSTWQHGSVQFPQAPDPDGSADLLKLLDGNPRTYQEWATEYYERRIRLAAVKHVYEQRPLTQEVVSILNRKLSLAALAGDIAEIGYPA